MLSKNNFFLAKMYFDSTDGLCVMYLRGRGRGGHKISTSNLKEIWIRRLKSGKNKSKYWCFLWKRGRVAFSQSESMFPISCKNSLELEAAASKKITYIRFLLWNSLCIVQRIGYTFIHSFTQVLTILFAQPASLSIFIYLFTISLNSMPILPASIITTIVWMYN